jgi:hypothetical protein
MKNELDRTTVHERRQMPRILMTFIAVLLPRGVRAAYLADFPEYYRSLPQFLPEAAAGIAGSYVAQAAAAFDKIVLAAQLAVTVFCFAAGSPMPGFGIVIGAILVALTLRDAYTHPWEGAMRKAWARTAAPPHVLDCLADSAIAGLFLMAAHALTSRITPSAAMPTTRLYHGAIICLPALATLRMLMRPKPWGKIPFRRSAMTPEKVYWASWRLTILWLAAVCFVIETNPNVIPSFVPYRDFVHGALPLTTFAIWRRVQRDAIQKGVVGETIKRQYKDLKREWMQANLLKGVKKHSQYYLAYIVLEALFFLQLAAPLVLGIRPWLSGQDAQVDLFRLLFNLAAFATLALTWTQVKLTNRVAAMVIRRAIHADKIREGDPLMAPAT